MWPVRCSRNCTLKTRAHIASFCAQISAIHRRLQLDITARNKLPPKGIFPPCPTVKNVSPTNHLPKEQHPRANGDTPR